MATLHFSNLPHDCTDSELQLWVESHGLKVEWSKVIHNAVSASAPAFAYAVVEGPSQSHGIIRELDGRILDRQTVSVREVSFRTSQDSAV